MSAHTHDVHSYIDVLIKFFGVYSVFKIDCWDIQM